MIKTKLIKYDLLLYKLSLSPKHTTVLIWGACDMHFLLCANTLQNKVYWIHQKTTEAWKFTALDKCCALLTYHKCSFAFPPQWKCKAMPTTKIFYVSHVFFLFNFIYSYYYYCKLKNFIFNTPANYQLLVHERVFALCEWIELVVVPLQLPTKSVVQFRLLTGKSASAAEIAASYCITIIIQWSVDI